MEPADSTLYALLISVGTYPSSDVGALPNASKDAGDLKQLIENGTSFIPKTKKVRWLADEDASKTAILDHIKEWLGASPRDSTVLFFFAGHGIHVNQTDESPTGTPGSYLVLSESRLGSPAEIKASAISAEDLRKAFDAVSARRQFIVLDCCHAQGLFEGRDLNASFLGQGATLAMQCLQGEGRALLAACRRQEKAYEAGENGLLTGHLLAGLRGAAAGLDGCISLLDLASYVLRECRGPSRQKPVFGANDLDDFPIAQCDPDTVLQESEWRLLYHKLRQSGPDVLDALLALLDPSESPREHRQSENERRQSENELRQSKNEKATRLITIARARGVNGRLQLDKDLSGDLQNVHADVLRKRVSQDLRWLDFVDQGLGFERCMGAVRQRGAFLIYGRPVRPTIRLLTEHRWLLRRLLFLLGDPEALEHCLVPVNAAPLGLDSDGNHLQVQVARLLGSRAREWPALVAKVVERGPTLVVIEPIEQLRTGELEEFLAQFWIPLNHQLDQAERLRGPVLLFLMSHEEQAPARLNGAAPIEQLARIEPLARGEVKAWFSEMRGRWHDAAQVSLQFHDGIPPDNALQVIFDKYVDLRLGHLSDDQYARTRNRLQDEWFLLNLPRR